MASTTTFRQVRNGIYANVEALTPASYDTAHKFEWFRLQHQLPLREWARANPQASFRRFELRTVGPKEDLELCDPAAKYSRVEALLTIAYPTASALYAVGTNVETAASLITLEDGMEADAQQIHDAIVAGANYVTGQQLATFALLPPDRSDDNVWFQDCRVVVEFLESQVT